MIALLLASYALSLVDLDDDDDDTEEQPCPPAPTSLSRSCSACSRAGEAIVEQLQARYGFGLPGFFAPA